MLDGPGPRQRKVGARRLRQHRNKSGVISLRPPDPERVFELVRTMAKSPFSYPDVGATRGEIPSGYNVDRYSTVLGRGDAVFESAKSSIQAWVPFRLSWIRTYPQAEPGDQVAVAVVVHLVGLWWTNISRVVYTIEEPGRFGFAYGTLGYHAEMGEEQFLITQDSDSNEVTYSILAFSRPRHTLARLGYPLSRAAQRRFGAESLEAMRQATSRPDA